MMAMNLDHGLAFQQWVNDTNQQDLRHVAKLLANLLTTVGGWEELDNFIYKNGNDPTLGDRYFPKVTRLLGQGGDMNASLQWFMKECSVAAGFPNIGNGYQNVHQYEQAQPLSTVTRSVKYGFGAQKENEQWHAKLRKAFYSLKTKAEEAAATGPAPQPQPNAGMHQPMMAHQLMTPTQGMPPGMMTPGMTGVTPQGMPYAHHHQPVQTPTPHHGHGHGMFSPHTTPQQSMHHSHHHPFNGGFNSTYGWVPGTPSNYPHTPSGPSSMHPPPTPTAAKGSFFDEKENDVNGALSRGFGGLDIRTTSSAHQDSYVSSFRGGNEDVSSIGGTEGTEDTLVQTTKRTEEQLMAHATFLSNPRHQKWLKRQESRKRRDASRACTSTTPAVYQNYRNDVLIAVEQKKPANPFLDFKELCMNEKSVYDEEDQREDSKIKETKGTLQSSALDFEEQKIRLQAKRKEKKDELDAQCQAAILELKNRIALLPSEFEEKKAQVNAECDASIVKLQTRHEEQERILNRKLQSYETTKQQLLAQKVDNLTYAMAHVHALDLTNDLFTNYEGPVMRDETDDEDFLGEIKLLEDKLDRLLDGIAKKQKGILADLVWNLPFAGIP